MSKCTEAELEKIMSKPEYANRTAVRVYERGDELFCEVNGVKVVASNPFLLDTKLDYIGAPSPRNLFLMEGV